MHREHQRDLPGDLRQCGQQRSERRWIVDIRRAVQRDESKASFEAVAISAGAAPSSASVFGTGTARAKLACKLSIITLPTNVTCSGLIPS